MFRLEYRIPVAVDLGRKMVGKYFHRETPGREWARWLVFLAVLFGTPGGPALAQNSLRIAAIVNDEAISVYDLNSRVHLALLSSRLPNDAATRRRMQAQILRNLIDEKLKLQEAKKLKITVEKKEIDQAIAELEGRNKMQPGAMRKYLRRRGLDRSTLTSQIEANIAWMKMVSRNVRAQGKIGDDLIVKHLNEDEGRNSGDQQLCNQSGICHVNLDDVVLEKDPTRRLTTNGGFCCTCCILHVGGGSCCCPSASGCGYGCGRW